MNGISIHHKRSDEAMIEKIKESLAAATPGTWEVNDFDMMYSAEIISEHPKGVFNGIASGIYVPNAHLIANAPEWLRYLIGEVERIERERDNALSLRNIALKHYNTAKEENEMLQRELAEYREEEDRPRFNMDAQGNLTLIEEE